MANFIKRPILLCILDGWGLKNGLAGDVLSVASTPVFDALWQKEPSATLKASSLAVGLPPNHMGNSEVGHLNIGAGRVVYQDLTKIIKAIADGDFFTNPVLLQNLSLAKTQGGNLHLMGLLSDGGVHSHINHLKALLRLAKKVGVKQCYIHCFLDGRDVAPTSGVDYLKDLSCYLQELQFGKIATVMGRFYAMDRDKRWDRIEKAWRTLVLGEGKIVANPILAVGQAYEKGMTDEFMEPMVVAEGQSALGLVQAKDSILFYNFRADRARELTRAFVDPDFLGFKRPQFPPINYCCMTQYDENLTLPVAFSKAKIANTLGEVLATNHKKQLRIAETEKYAHVTFFFNGGVEEPSLYEDRILIPSPKVATYDLQPEMSAQEVTDSVIEKIEAAVYDVIILNFANADMLGHTGIFAAAKQAVEKVDQCLGRIVGAVQQAGGVLLITADHGNVEKMLTENGEPVTSHTVSDVPFILVGQEACSLRQGGSLQDIAPTVLQLAGLPKPLEMTGQTLILSL